MSKWHHPPTAALEIESQRGNITTNCFVRLGDPNESRPTIAWLTLPKRSQDGEAKWLEFVSTGGISRYVMILVNVRECTQDGRKVVGEIRSLSAEFLSAPQVRAGNEIDGRVGRVMRMLEVGLSWTDKLIIKTNDSPKPKVFPFEERLRGRGRSSGRVSQWSIRYETTGLTRTTNAPLVVREPRSNNGIPDQRRTCNQYHLDSSRQPFDPVSLLTDCPAEPPPDRSGLRFPNHTFITVVNTSENC